MRKPEEVNDSLLEFKTKVAEAKREYVVSAYRYKIESVYPKDHIAIHPRKPKDDVVND